MGEDRLSQDELAVVLRRAAELDPTPVPDEGLSVGAVEAAAAEVGLPPAAVRQAVAELRAGLLAAPDGAGAGAVVVEAAVVPLEPEAARDEVSRWLEAQTFQCHRGRDGVEVWRQREDWVAGMQRRFDWSAAVRLKGVHEVVVRVLAVEEGTLVRLEATLVGLGMVAPAAGIGVGGVLAGAVATPVAMINLGAPVDLAAVAVVTGAGAFGGWRAGRSIRRNRRDRVADELAAALDRLAAGRTVDQSALQRLRVRVRAGRRGRWA